MAMEYDNMKSQKEKLEEENTKLKEEIIRMNKINASVFETDSQLDIRPEDLPNRYRKYHVIFVDERAY